MLSYEQYNLECAMVKDALSNEVTFESGRVRAMDVSDCPDMARNAKFTDDWQDPFDTCEACMDDLEHEMLMAELNEYAS